MRICELSVYYRSHRLAKPIVLQNALFEHIHTSIHHQNFNIDSLMHIDIYCNFYTGEMR
jgi:hypothetical protein